MAYSGQSCQKKVNAGSDGRKPWSDREERLLREWVVEKVTYLAISERLGRTEWSVKSKAREMGLQSKAVRPGWTEARVERLKLLWKDGWSASQIARDLGDVTRNAVIGKVGRLGLMGRSRPSRPVARKKVIPRLRKIKRTNASVIAVKRAPKRKPVAPEPDTSGIPFEDLTDKTCKWPLGDGPPFSFCGCKPAEGSPYCEHHTQRAGAVSAARMAWGKSADRALERHAA